MVRPHAIFVGVFVLVLVRLLIDPWLSNDLRVLSRPVSQPTRSWQKQAVYTYDDYGDEPLQPTRPLWPGTGKVYPANMMERYEDASSKDELIRTLYEYSMPEELKPEREAYHISISDPLISPAATRGIFRAAKPLCAALGDNVAIVGNGPIRPADMQALEANASCVIRFNRISLKYVTPVVWPIDRRRPGLLLGARIYGQSGTMSARPSTTGVQTRRGARWTPWWTTRH